MRREVFFLCWVLMSSALIVRGNAEEEELFDKTSEENLSKLLGALERTYGEGGLEEKEAKHLHYHESPPHGGQHHGEEHPGHEQHGEHGEYQDKSDVNDETKSEYAYRNDMFEEVRWQDVYVDEYVAREGRVMNSLTSAQEKAILNLHNELRRKEGSSNMEELKYNPKLADLGQTWSRRCVFEHGQPPYSEANIGYKNLGQNIYAHSDPAFKVEDAVHAWYDEKKDYQYNSASCNAGKVCGHYTAVTWAKTSEVGCGLTFCPSISGLTKSHFIVCNYAPAGNFQGEKPFLKGTPCTQCDSGKFYCDNNLCDKSCNSEGAGCQCKAACQKGGKKTSSCKCECPAGSSGPDCGLQCADRDPKCGANPGYPQFLCTMSDPNWAFVKEKCPKLCKQCSKKRSEDDSAIVLKRLMLGYLQKEQERNNMLE